MKFNLLSRNFDSVSKATSLFSFMYLIFFSPFSLFLKETDFRIQTTDKPSLTSQIDDQF